ncbi:MAG TPA: biotin/lipoyl-containing protein [Anaerolineales bacterium]|nr:biotin/lipoyl-containing protein [Anaerolineales bacterium]
MKLNFNNHTLELTPIGKSYRVAVGEKTALVEILRAENGRLDLLIDGKRIIAYISFDNTKRWVTINGQTSILTKSSDTRKSGGSHVHTAGELTAPMPGQIRAVHVREGDAVSKGQTLLILEAMKMEIRIQSPMDGVVKSLAVKQGQTVEREQTLITVE